MTESRVFHLHAAAATRSLAASLARALPPGVLVLLRGNLGAGKTTFAQGMAQGLGIDEPVISPTFVLIREYELSLDPGRPERFVHLDLYRLSGPADLPGLGLDELIDDAVVVLEWPERGEGHLPEAQVEVSLVAVSAPDEDSPSNRSSKSSTEEEREGEDATDRGDRRLDVSGDGSTGFSDEPRRIEILARGSAISALVELSSGPQPDDLRRREADGGDGVNDG